jgi:hypothetical protein
MPANEICDRSDSPWDESKASLNWLRRRVGEGLGWR